LIAFPPDWILGGEYTPRPSDWQKYPTQSGQRFYWFIGQHRNPSGGLWTADALVGHTYAIYENGTLSTVYYDDTCGDRDMDDFVLEAAIVGRCSWAEVIQASNQEAINKRVARKGLPKLKSRFTRIRRIVRVGAPLGRRQKTPRRRDSVLGKKIKNGKGG
jgi:hypothetical protein